MTIDINAIREALPHRYPMLLVDRVLEVSEDEITAIKNVTITRSKEKKGREEKETKVGKKREGGKGGSRGGGGRTRGEGAGWLYYQRDS